MQSHDKGCQTDLRDVLASAHDLVPDAVHGLVPLRLHGKLAGDVVRAEDGLQVHPGYLALAPLLQNVLVNKAM